MERSTWTTQPAPRRLAVTVAALATLAAGSAAAATGLDPARFSPKVDHPLVPLASLRSTTFEGGGNRVVSRVLRKPARVAGILVTVVQVREYANGALTERTSDYYAQTRDGAVWYVGERVDDYRDGKIVGHSGAWLAGRNGARPGLFMPVRPRVGQVFEQERAPGIAEDRSTVVAVGLTVTVPAGRFRDCIRTRDYAPIGNSTEHKVYCPGVGLVREEGGGAPLELTAYE